MKMGSDAKDILKDHLCLARKPKLAISDKR